MVYCLFCPRKYKTKKAYKSHSESLTHKQKEKEIKKDVISFRKLFLTNFSSFIYKYNTYKDLEEVYRGYIKDNIIGYRDVGYKNIEAIIKDLTDLVDVKEKDNKFFVKGYDRYVQNEATECVSCTSSEPLSFEEISTYEEYEGNQEDLLNLLKN